MPTPSSVSANAPAASGLWSRLGLARRLTLTIAAVVVVVGILLSIHLLREDARDAEAAFKQRLEQTLDLLAPQVAEYAVIGDYASAEERIRSYVSRDASLDTLTWTTVRERKVSARATDDAAAVPGWFATLAGMPAVEVTRPVNLGGTPYGTLTAEVYPTTGLRPLWRDFLYHAAGVFLAAILLVGAATWLLRKNLRVLEELAHSAERFSHGDYQGRVRAEGSPEMVAAALAFNHMADQITDLLKSISQSRTQLHEQLHFVQQLIEVLPNPVYFKDTHGTYLGVNQAFERFFGRPREWVIGKTVYDLYPTDQALAARHDALDRELWEKRGSQSYEITIIAANSEPRDTIYNKATFTRADSSDVAGLIGMIVDITDLRRTQTELRQEKDRAQVTLESINDGVITTDAAGKINYMNPVAQQLTHWALDDARGLDFANVIQILDEKTESARSDLATACLAGEAPVRWTDGIALRGQHGDIVSIEASAAPIRGRDGQTMGAVMVFRDVTQSRLMASQLSWHARHDPLTGLLNRYAFEERLREAIESAGAQKARHALLYLDLDQFKVVNDTCGHLAGDELLKQLCPLLQHHIRESDALARLGGDEFGLLLERCPIEKAVGISQNLLTTIRQFRFSWEDKYFSVGVSIGLVTIDEESGEMTKLLSQADLACYAAKEAGRNRLHIYERQNREIAQRQSEMQWISRLTRAVEQDQLVLYCQPIVALQEGGAKGLHLEVLVRLRAEDRTLIPPGYFLPAAERYSLMPAVDQWVIDRTFALLASNLERLRGVHTCAINLSGHSLGDPQIAETVSAKLRAHGIPARLICFEVTETAAIANLARTRELIQAVKQLGCRFSLDDFGSGLSSFGYLKTLPVDYLKIDGSFVKNMAESPTDSAMVEAINRIGHVMGIETIAEFVENDVTRDRLRMIGVDYAQGYGIAPPQPLAELITALHMPNP